MPEILKASSGREAPSVLVVDDDMDALAEVCELVDALGLSVKGVDTVRSALVAVADDKNIGLIITDLKMSVLDGFDLIAELDARFGAQRHIPKIVLSGFPSYDNAVASMRLGVLDFIEKPATLEKLKTAIRGAFQKVIPPRDSEGNGLEPFKADLPPGGGSVRAGSWTRLYQRTAKAAFAPRGDYQVPAVLRSSVGHPARPDGSKAQQPGCFRFECLRGRAGAFQYWFAVCQPAGEGRSGGAL